MWAFPAAVILLVLSVANGLMFNLEPNNRKCLKEEIHKGVLVTGEYDIAQQPNQVREGLFTRGVARPNLGSIPNVLRDAVRREFVARVNRPLMSCAHKRLGANLLLAEKNKTKTTKQYFSHCDETIL
jgi:hypothetical protein